MSTTSVEQWLSDLQLANPERHALVLSARTAIQSAVPQTTERVMYGGIMIAAGKPFCGVFAYAEHVSVEFGRGCELNDVHGVLEGQGKFRRHIKLRNEADIAGKQLGDYVRQAAALAQSE